MAGLLEGLKVVDMGHVVAIPCAGSMFRDWGAEVIKVEPITGELARGTTRSGGKSRVITLAGGEEVNWPIEVHNRGKKGLALDLKKQAGKEILYRLVKEADIFMSNYEVSALKSLNLDYATLSQINPRLIYAVLTGYGTVGPDKDQRGFDLTAAWARSGAQYLTSEEGRPPPPQRPGMMDKTAAAHLVAGMLAAIIHRDRTGEGQELQISLYHTAVWSISTDIQGNLVGEPFPIHNRTETKSPLSNLYPTKDGRWFMLLMPQSDISWPDLCRAIARPELENDPRFNDMDVREQNSKALIRILDEIFTTKTLKEWEKLLTENNCIYGRVQSPLEVTTDPQALANNFFTDVQYPSGGEMKLVNTPVKFTQNPATIKGPAPQIGQHTEETLLELGYSWEDMVKLKDEGVIL